VPGHVQRPGWPGRRWKDQQHDRGQHGKLPAESLVGIGSPSRTQNTALYSTFAVFAFFGGTFVNRLGVKSTLAFGGVGYCIYAIALLVSVHSSHVGGFNIFAGALLGVCAGLLWTAQGTIMISYPNEGQKGRYFAWFWGIFNMGAVIGSLVSRHGRHSALSQCLQFQR
jgi:MFS family permease